MPSRAGRRPPPSQRRTGSKSRGRPSFVPATQFPAKDDDSDSNSDDPLAMSPIPSHAARRDVMSSPDMRAGPSTQILSSPPAIASRRSGGNRRTRAAMRKDREVEVEQLGHEDLIPPSEDEEYEAWRASRQARTNKGNDHPAEDGVIYPRSEDGAEPESRMGLKRPRKPDKMPDREHLSKRFDSLLSSPPPESPSTSTAPSYSERGSRDTSPTQPLSIIEDDDSEFSFYQGDHDMALLSDGVGDHVISRLVTDIAPNIACEGQQPVEEMISVAGQNSGGVQEGGVPGSSGESDQLVDANPTEIVHNAQRQPTNPDQIDVDMASPPESQLAQPMVSSPFADKPRATTPLAVSSGDTDNAEISIYDTTMSVNMDDIDAAFADLHAETQPAIMQHKIASSPILGPALVKSEQGTLSQTSTLDGEVEAATTTIADLHKEPLAAGFEQNSDSLLIGLAVSPERAQTVLSTDNIQMDHAQSLAESQDPLDLLRSLDAHAPTPSEHEPQRRSPFATATKESDDNDLAAGPQQPHRMPSPSPAQPLSSSVPLSQTFAALVDVPVHSSDTPEPASLHPVDPALQQFRGVRTFRTRTVLQLQPYTKERQIYEAALRKGGLKKGKKAVAPAREVTQEDEEDEGQDDSSASEAYGQPSPDRIVIGNTPPARLPREPKQLIEADYDEYFLEHGREPDADDPEAAERLQSIARRRLKMAKEAKKRKKAAKLEKMQFESLMRHVEHDGLTSGDDQPMAPVDTVERRVRTTQPRTINRALRVASRTPVGLQTYKAKRQSRNRALFASSPPSDEAGPVATRKAVAEVSPTSHTGTPMASFKTALSDSGNEDMDVGYGQPPDDFPTDNYTPLPDSPSLRHTGSFFVNDLGSRPRAPSNAQSHTSSDESGVTHDPRKRIARRMMPAAMLKRLEAEAADKERRRQDGKRKEQKDVKSPLRPGRAVVRRGGGLGGHDGINSLFDDEADSGTESQASARLSASLTEDQPIAISDDTGSSSEAIEDNYAEHSLARLRRGDFEGIIAGRGDAQSRSILERARQRRNRRPALGLAKRVKATPLSKGNHTMIQSRLDFPVTDPPVTPVTKTSKKRHLQAKDPKRRPAIRLDDHVIFATVGFEFDSAEETPARPSSKHKRSATKRPFVRTPSVNIPHSDPLDTSMGKARSWANFDRFPIDFDITPLPSGLYCSSTSVPGSGRLADLIRLMRDGQVDHLVVPASVHYGIDLRDDLSPGSIQSIIPLLFDAILRQVTLAANEPNHDPPNLEPLAFLGRYVSLRHADMAEDMLPLLGVLSDAAKQLIIRLGEVTIGHTKHGRSTRLTVLGLFWELLDLVLRIDRSSNNAHGSLVYECTISLLGKLIALGFDRTVRPLKLIMRGESESAEITDSSISLWISVIHATAAFDDYRGNPIGDTFTASLDNAINTAFHLDRVGPIAAERIWFLTFGLCALSQFDVHGRISSVFITMPRWQLVRRAIGLIKVAYDEDAEKRAHLDQLQGRDRYVKAMMARCVRLSAVWKWSFDRESFSVATRDLGVIFKDRQYRNLPTEPAVDYPTFITRYDMSLTAEEDAKRETAFELYLRLVCVAASDIISAAQTLSEAQQAEKDVQRLVMSIIPVSAIKFNRLFPPSPKDLGQLVNRYSTMIAACYFSPSLLSYLLAISKRWLQFEQADFDSRQICIRGLMYLGVSRRHHQQPLEPVVDRLAEMMGVLQAELDQCSGPSAQTLAPDRTEIERTMILMVSCFRQMIRHHSFDPEGQSQPVYPDPCLLHESESRRARILLTHPGWTARIFDLNLVKDFKCGLEVVATIQEFLNNRANVLPRLARQRREAKGSLSESMDEFGSLGIDFTDADVLALGGEVPEGSDPVDRLDAEFAETIEKVISPKIYRLLSDMLPPVSPDETEAEAIERRGFVGKLTECWSDCAAVLVVEHQKMEWSTFITPFGKQSWLRLGDERGRLQVGLHFMLNAARLDPACFGQYEEDFVALLFQVIGTDRLSVEHKYTAALLAMSGALDHPLLQPLIGSESFDKEMSGSQFMEARSDGLRAIFTAIPTLLRSPRTPASIKSLTYRCINLFVSSLILYDKSIKSTTVLHKESYRAFTHTIVRDLSRIAGDFITPMSVPGLKHFKL
ncbi:hypothetical protein IAU60_003560 [Kwoniella sp. DSM 27419]